MLADFIVKSLTWFTVSTICACFVELHGTYFCSRAITELITSEDKQMMLVAKEGDDSSSD
jgi:hypothetical protein